MDELDYDVNITNDIEIDSEPPEKRSLDPEQVIDSKEQESKDINYQEENQDQNLDQEQISDNEQGKNEEEKDKTKKDPIDEKENKYKLSLARLRKKNSDYQKKIKELENRYTQAVEYGYKADMAVADGLEVGIKASVENLEKELESAIAEGDVSRQVQASKKMAELIAQQERVREKRLMQQAYQQVPQQQQPEYVYDPDSDENEARADWIRRNKWADERNSNFNPEMVEEVAYVAGQLQSEFRRKGQGHLVFQEEYFNKLDDYVQRNFFNESPRSNNKTTTAVKTPVRGTSSTARLKLPPLSKEQKEMCMQNNIPEEVFKENWAKRLNKA